MAMRPFTSGGGHHDDAFVGGEAVHFHQQLVQGLFALVVTAAQARAAMAAHGVDLIDEHDAGAVALGLLKQIAYAGSAHAHEHFHEVRTGNGEEGDVRFPGHGFRKQRLARSGRAHQQHALGNARAQVGVVLGVLEEVHDLPEFFLFLVRPGHVGEGNLVLAGVHHGGAAFAEVHHPSAAAGLLAHDVPPHHHQQHDGNHIGQHFDIPGRNDGSQVFDLKAQVMDGYGAHVLARFVGGHGQYGVVKVRADGGFKVIGAAGIIRQGHLAVLQPPHQIDVPDGNPVHLALINELEQLGIFDAAIHRIDAPGQQHDQKNKRRDHRDIADQAARHFTQIRILLSRIGNKSKKDNDILYHKQGWFDNHFSSAL